MGKWSCITVGTVVAV